MTISPAGIARIKGYESCKLHVYDDVAGLPTIGWGHLIVAGEPFKSDTKITQAEADALFEKDLNPVVLGVEALLEVAIGQEQFDSVCSLAFNIGLGDKGLRGSSFLRAINAGATSAVIRSKLLLWNKITDPKTKKLVPSDGLLNRRIDEGKAWP